MSRAIITESYLTDIADAIRAKNGSSSTYTPPQMAAAIAAIPTGGGGGGGGVKPYPALPAEYQELEYLSTGPEQSYPYITFTTAIESGDIVILKYQGEGVIAGNEQSFNINVYGVSKFDIFVYGSYAPIWKSWEQITQQLGDTAAIGLRFSGRYVNVNYGLWRANSYTYTGKLYKFLVINPYYFELNGATVDDIEQTLAYRIALLPCYRKSDDVNGFYDVVNNQFYTAQQGSFARGPEV